MIHRSSLFALRFFAVIGMFGQVPASNGGGHGMDGDGSVNVEGELKQWHKVTLTLSGPHAAERDTGPNPFMDYRFTVTFSHESREPT